ncbi:MAG TPA: hypothetical protein VGT08_05150 [Terracidiphilus sp.]|nr:hypothetical protein [Terracidiphilus sp.]
MISRNIALVAALIFSVSMIANGEAAPVSSWVHSGKSGKLTYKQLSTGDKIVDFSYAGYGGGAVKIPNFSVKKSVAASGEDDTAAIQKAIDEVSGLPLVHGARGAVLLQKGHFHCDGTLRLNAAGVVLRGSGIGADGTVIEMTGDPHLAISVGGKTKILTTGAPTQVSDAYVPSGFQSLHVTDVSSFAVGDRVRITRPVTDKWLHFMGMDALSRNGKKETWVSGELETVRTITGIAGKKLILDVPLTDSYDRAQLEPSGATVAKVEESGAITNIGIEDLGLSAPARKITLSDKAFNGLQMQGVVDGWARNLQFVDTTEAVGIGRGSRRITIEKVDVVQSISIQGAAKPADFSLNGTQTLIDRCTATGDNVFYIATGPTMQGPNVVLHCIFRGNGHVQPHQRWSTGILIDSCDVPEGGIDLMNRGEMGSGHGWAMGWGVAWNNTAKSYLIQMPPGSANWAIGNRGQQLLSKMQTYGPGPEFPPLPQGFIESQGTPVMPKSLYLQQLRDRLGVRVLKNMGFNASE